MVGLTGAEVLTGGEVDSSPHLAASTTESQVSCIYS